MELEGGCRPDLILLHQADCMGAKAGGAWGWGWRVFNRI